MANTINVPMVAANGWQVGTTLAGAKVGISSGGTYCVSTGVPDPSLVGHRFLGEPIDAPLGVGETLYVKPDSDCTLIVTGVG